MKRRRTLILLICLLLLGIPIGLCVPVFLQQQRDHALIDAIKTDDTLTALAALKRGADPNAHDYDPKALSSRERLRRLVDRMLHRNVKPGSKEENESDEPALMLAVESHNRSGEEGYSRPTEQAAVVQALLEKGADPNWADPKGQTALTTAAAWGLKESMRHLMEHGAYINAHENPDARDTAGYTPLMVAVVMNGQADTVQVLLEHGADVNLRDAAGLTVLDHALEMQSSGPTVTPPSALVQILKHAGAKTGKELDARHKR